MWGMMGFCFFSSNSACGRSSNDMLRDGGGAPQGVAFDESTTEIGHGCVVIKRNSLPATWDTDCC